MLKNDNLVLKMYLQKMIMDYSNSMTK